ncbi:methyltransferase domain-containing protein [uncultured Pseudacidovorax sp.]|uniref:class I SAM-dependent methyltransferase n=1 Tax=uncultured Pseudacidovorax sp. TaxID=679313 RepID=UPI0025D7606E|nr:methyltransferase domain-containing protein [uncultured Pseudacidovorax sp.]
MKDYSLKSGERYSTLDTDLIGGDHLWRYRYAASRAKALGTRPFGADVFCGSGYGSKILAEGTDGFVLGIDGSTEAIQNANDKVLHPGILYAAKTFPFDLPEQAFDYVASMESLEHVKSFDAFFHVLAKSVRRGGRLFISAPDESVMPYTGYIWHHKHFVIGELRAMAARCGLREVLAVSTNCHVLKDGKTALFYPYQLDSERSLPVGEGDTLFCEFEKV